MITSGMSLFMGLVSAISFSVDWAAFRASGDSSRVEFFYGIPHDQLQLYTQTDSGLFSLFSVRLEMTGIGSEFREQGTILKRARLASFDEAKRARRSFVDGFSVLAPPGRHRYRLTVAESSSVGFNQGVREESLALEAFGPGLALSSLQLGASTVTDTVTGAVSVIPNPGLVFGAGGSDAVYVYFEGYGLSADTNQYRVDLAVIRPEPGGVDTVVQGRPVFRAKSGTSVATALGVNIEGLAPGRYALALCLTDLGTDRQVSQVHRFRVGGEQAEPGFRVSLDSLTERERRFYLEIEHIATPKEFKYFRALSDSGQQAWLAWFWSRHNLTEYARRMEAATEKYRRQRTPGVKTDRGRIYVKYGEPDAIEQKVIETESRPREYWHYYGSGYTFVFIDIRGDGNYRLAWTNSREEPPTGFEEYLTPAEQEEFR